MKLCSLSKLKRLLGIDESDESKDDILTYHIESASASIVEFLGYDPRRRVVEGEKQAVNNRQLLELDYLPIQSVESVKIGGSSISDFQVLPRYSKNGFLYRGSGWSGAWYTRGMTYDPVGGAYEVEIDYTAGWFLPDDEGYIAGEAESLPTSISSACTRLALIYYNQRAAESEGILSHSEGGISTTFGESDESELTAGALPKSVAAMIATYARAGLA